jgi:hypothetical protein
LIRIPVIGQAIGFDFGKSFQNSQEGIHVSQVEVKEHFPSIFGLDVDCVVACVEPFPEDLADVTQRDVEVVEGLVLEGFDAHVIESFAAMRRAEDNEAISTDFDMSLDDCQDIDEETLGLELLQLLLLGQVGREVVESEQL